MATVAQQGLATKTHSAPVSGQTLQHLIAAVYLPAHPYVRCSAVITSAAA